MKTKSVLQHTKVGKSIVAGIEADRIMLATEDQEGVSYKPHVYAYAKIGTFP